MTPQEEVEELLKPLYNLYQHTAIRDDFESQDGDKISAARARASHLATKDALDLVKLLPLAELIAVARAATRVGGERIEFEGSEHYAVVIEEVDELDNALQVLRATRKVEL